MQADRRPLETSEQWAESDQELEVKEEQEKVLFLGVGRSFHFLGSISQRGQMQHWVRELLLELFHQVKIWQLLPSLFQC
jgi:aromatic ring-opening dioxygenase catalytic subunit (LigB family)